MVRACHVIFGTYGFWLPNDPRGSWSDFVGSWDLFRYGSATKVWTRRSSARNLHDREARQRAKEALKYPPVRLTGEQARAAVRGFTRYAAHANLTVWACSMLPEHVHMVFHRANRTAEHLVNRLKGAATKQMMVEGIHPLEAHARSGRRPPSPWARGLHKVFLNSKQRFSGRSTMSSRIPSRKAKAGRNGTSCFRIQRFAAMRNYRNEAYTPGNDMRVPPDALPGGRG